MRALRAFADRPWAVSTIAFAAVAGLTGIAAGGPASNPEDIKASVAPDNARICKTSFVPVTLEPGNPLTPGAPPGVAAPAEVGAQQVLVKLCLPKSKPNTGVVQLLVHGITYDHRYWNIADPANAKGDRYSWEAAAAKAGYATLALDRIGSGTSTHPPSVFVDIDSNATAIHQVVQALRAGAIASPTTPTKFKQVVLVGHSYGSMTSWFEASRYQDVDALVITSATHNVHELTSAASIESAHYPAVLDPQFANTTLDPGYVTSMPGKRYDQYYAPADVDLGIVARDEATKGTFTQSEVYNYPVVFRTHLDIRAPVFLIIGSLDGIFCSQIAVDLAAPCQTSAALIANERPWYGPGVPSMDAHIVQGAGHDLNAMYSSQQTFNAVTQWLTQKVPAH